MYNSHAPWAKALNLEKCLKKDNKQVISYDPSVVKSATTLYMYLIITIEGAKNFRLWKAAVCVVVYVTMSNMENHIITVKVCVKGQLGIFQLIDLA